MMRVISPHLDDAVLSLGQWFATSPGEIEVVTVFAGVPLDHDLLTPYDQSSGFASSREAMQARRLEDRDATELLEVVPVHWRYLDQQYAPDRLTDHTAIADDLADLYSPTEHMLAPLGLGHPDHRVVADMARVAVARLAGETLVGLLLYEELPYRVLNPQEVHERLEEVRSEGWTISELTWPLAQGGRRERLDKAEAIAQYRSQFPRGAEDPCLLVPERVWQITR